MANKPFQPGDKVWFLHKDALGHSIRLDGVVDPRVTTQTLTEAHHFVDIGNIRLLVPEKDMRHVEETNEGAK